MVICICIHRLVVKRIIKYPILQQANNMCVFKTFIKFQDIFVSENWKKDI